jgi:hypothetical protein
VPDDNLVGKAFYKVYPFQDFQKFNDWKYHMGWKS